MVIRYYISELLEIFGNMVFTDNNKISPRMLEAQFPRWKQQAIFIAYNGSKTSKANKFINPSNYVKSRSTYDINIQITGAEFVRFVIEPPVNIDDRFNGFTFVGDEKTQKAFTQLVSPNSYSVNKDANLITVNDVCFFASDSDLDIFGNIQVREVSFNYIPFDVMNVSIWDSSTKTYRLFNPETDNYPISGDIWNIMKQIAVAELTPPNLRPADMTNDGSGTIERQTNS